MMEHQETGHKRRVRYSGTHPKSYKEKYKEHGPEKYADTIEKVIRKGSTPAGMHLSIMVKEILDFLQIKSGQTGLDATLGYGEPRDFTPLDTPYIFLDNGTQTVKMQFDTIPTKIQNHCSFHPARG